MKFALLASGSKGNCCLIKHKDTKLVIDCGTTRKYLKSCFEQISYDPHAEQCTSDYAYTQRPYRTDEAV